MIFRPQTPVDGLAVHNTTTEDLMKISELAVAKFAVTMVINHMYVQVEAAAVFDRVLAESEKTLTRTRDLSVRVDKIRDDVTP